MMIVGTVLVFRLTRDAATDATIDSENSLRAQLRVAAQNKPFRVLVACFIAQAAGVAAMLAGVQYFADHVLHDKDATSLLFICVVGPAILVMPIWNLVVPVGKLRGYVAASLLLTVATFALVTARWLRSRPCTGSSRSSEPGTPGSSYSVWRCSPTASPTTPPAPAGARPGCSPACGPPGRPSDWRSGVHLGQTIELFGYVPSTTGHAAPQSSMAELGVLRFHVVPGIVVALALLFLRAYDLSAERLAGMAQPAGAPVVT